MFGRLLLGCVCLSIAGLPLAAAQPPARPPAKVIRRAAGPITIDGSLSDPGWKGATVYDTWFETNPGDNTPPKVKSVGYVTYDDRFFYVGIEMWDPNPSQIRSVYGDHDNLSGNVDDYAGVLLDTRDDGKTGYLFLVNFHNTQYDATTDDASGEDSSPDFFWDSATKRTDHGWNVELRIPFSSLRYVGSSPARWGITLYRNMPRDRRYQMFTDKLPRGGNCFVCQWGQLTGLEGLPAGGHIVAAPYTSARLDGAREGDLGTPVHYDSPVGEAGADVKWTPTANTAVDATLNPDFSQVESDVAVISTNQRFAIFFPEKRPFFLEGTDLFASPIQAVYTRTITAPRWGLRSTGKFEKNAYTVLVADDRGGGSVIVPSALGSDFADQNFKSTVFVGRFKHDLGGNSFVSLLGTARELSGGGHNRVLGPDFRWVSEKQTVSGQLLFSDSRTPDRPDLASEWNGQTLRSHAGDFWYQYSSRTNDFFSEYKDFGKKFRADNGFVPQVDYRSNYVELGHTYWPKDAFFSRVRAFSMAQYDAQQNGARLYSLLSAGVGADGKFRSFTRFRYAYEKVRSDNEAVRSGKQQIFTRHQLLYTVQFGLSRILSFVTFDGWVGQDVDFANNRLARGANTTMTGTLRTNDHLQIDLTAGERWLSENLGPEGTGRLFTSQVERVRAMYTFNSRMFLRAIVQNQRTNRNVALYVDEADHHGGSLATQLLFAYKINWQTLVYLGVGDQQAATIDEGTLRPDTRQVFMKVSYAFQR